MIFLMSGLTQTWEVASVVFEHVLAKPNSQSCSPEGRGGGGWGVRIQRKKLVCARGVIHPGKESSGDVSIFPKRESSGGSLTIWEALVSTRYRVVLEQGRPLFRSREERRQLEGVFKQVPTQQTISCADCVGGVIWPWTH